MTDPSRLAIISGCSGYGGLDEAVSAATGGTVVAHIEYDDAPSKILEHRYPGVPNYHDVTKVDWQSMADDVVPEGWELCLTAGYPCQPFSSAGKRRGVEDERHLWPYFAEGIRQLRPALVVFENVRNHLNLGFDQVLADMADLGYDTTWTLLRASDVGAPHGRARLFIVGRRQVHPAPARTPLARLKGEDWMEPGEGLFGAIPWAGKIPTTGRVVDGGMFPLTLPELPAAAPAGPLLATPDAGLFNDGQDVDVYRARKARELAKGYNGNGGGTPLAMQVRLLKTPTAQLAINGGSQHPDKRKEGGHGPTLADEVEHYLVPAAVVTDDPDRQLLPTPCTGDTWGEQGPEDPAEWEAWKAERAERGIATGQGMLSTAVAKFLPTPTARLGNSRGSSHPDRRHELQPKRSGELDEVAVHLLPSPIASELGERLLPTPEASDGSGGRVTAEEGGQRPSGAKRAITLATAVHHGVTARVEDGELLPTPTAWEQRGDVDSGQADRNLLPMTAQRIAAAQPVEGPLLPAPTCQDGAGSGGPSQFDRNSLPLNALATTFAEAPGLLPTPGTLDHIEKRTTHAGGNPTLQGAVGGTNPADLERHQRAGRLAPGEADPDGELFPTPRATRGGSGTETMYALGAERADENRPQGEVLLPAPRATDATKGSPNQHGSKGDLMLVPVVMQLLPEEEGGAWRRDPVTGQRLLPSPVATDALGSRNATAYRGPEAGDNNAGTTLTDVMWQAAGADGPTRGADAPPYTPITDWGPYAGAVRRWEAIVGPAPAPTEPNTAGKQRLAPAFPEWMMGLPRGWVTDVPGLGRNDKLKAVGNGVCPQQGYVAVMRQLAALPW